jgi:hypothetical protein
MDLIYYPGGKSLPSMSKPTFIPNQKVREGLYVQVLQTNRFSYTSFVFGNGNDFTGTSEVRNRRRRLLAPK